MSAEGLLVSRHQVKLAPGRRLVAVIAHVAAGSIHAVRAAGKTVTLQQTLVPVVAGKRRKSTFRAYGVGEELVRPPMVAQRSALDRARCNDRIIMKEIRSSYILICLDREEVSLHQIMSETAPTKIFEQPLCIFPPFG